MIRALSWLRATRLPGAGRTLCAAAAPAVSARAQPQDILASGRAAGVVRVVRVARIEFIADLFKTFVEGLKADKYDLVMNDLTRTVARAKQVDFSAPHSVQDFCIFVRAATNDIKDKPDLKDKRVGMTAGTSNESWSRANLTNAEIVTYDNGWLVFNDLVISRIHDVVSSRSVA